MRQPGAEKGVRFFWASPNDCIEQRKDCRKGDLLGVCLSREYSSVFLHEIICLDISLALFY
jgi:hypothetical protein